WTKSTDTFTLAGTAFVTVGGLNNLSVKFGHDSTPGLTITSGDLTQLDMTVDSNFRVGTVDFGTKGLEFTWTKSTDTFTLKGTAFVTVVGLDNLSVKFGHDSTPGLTITSGDLTQLDMTLDSNFRVGSVVFGTKGLEFTWTKSTNIFTVKGTA